MSTVRFSTLKEKTRRLGRWDKTILVCSLLVVADGLITLPYWHLEQVPTTLALGPGGMMIAKISGVSGLLFVWFRMDGVRSHFVAKSSVACLTFLYVFVVTSNVAYLLLR